jgi:hypothetical protein
MNRMSEDEIERRLERMVDKNYPNKDKEKIRCECGQGNVFHIRFGGTITPVCTATIEKYWALYGEYPSFGGGFLAPLEPRIKDSPAY